MSKNDGLFCMVCGKPLKVCPICEIGSSWKRLVCSEKHNQVRNIVLQYRDGYVTRAQAKNRLNSLGVSNGDGLTDTYRNFMNQIFSSDDMNEKKDSYHPVAAAKSIKRKSK